MLPPNDQYLSAPRRIPTFNTCLAIRTHTSNTHKILTIKTVRKVPARKYSYRHFCRFLQRTPVRLVLSSFILPAMPHSADVRAYAPIYLCVLGVLIMMMIFAAEPHESIYGYEIHTSSGYDGSSSSSRGSSFSNLRQRHIENNFNPRHNRGGAAGRNADHHLEAKDDYHEHKHR